MTNLEMTCTACSVTKPVDAFERRGAGRRRQCRECMNAKDRTPERKAVRNANRRKTQPLEWRRAAQRRKFKTRAEKHPEKIKAKRIVRSALISGDLVRPSACEDCGTTPPVTRDGRSGIQAHHHDYSKPLDVQWLCYLCHSKVHQGEAA